MKLKCFVTFLLVINTSVLYAADLRGKLTGINDIQITVNCNGIKKSTGVSSSGNFHVADLPANKACHFTASKGNKVSVQIPFNSTKSVTVYNGSLKLFGNKILVLRK